jgi:hypothetical protein
VLKEQESKSANSESKLDKRDDVSNKIKEIGDKIRNMKLEKASKVNIYLIEKTTIKKTKIKYLGSNRKGSKSITGLQKTV